MVLPAPNSYLEWTETIILNFPRDLQRLPTLTPVGLRKTDLFYSENLCLYTKVCSPQRKRIASVLLLELESQTFIKLFAEGV